MPASSENLSSGSRPKRWSRKQYLIFFTAMVITAGICPLSDRLDGSLFLVLDIILVAAIPAFSWTAYRQLRDGKVPSIPHWKRYLQTIVGSWTFGLLVLTVYANRDTALRTAGFSFQSAEVFGGWCLVLAAGSAVLFGLLNWSMARGWLPAGPRGLSLLPETRSERLACVFLLSPTVGFCEELLYRSYALRELPHWWKGCPTILSLFVSCLLFALAHTARGGTAVLYTFILGALFAWPVLHSGTLYPSIVVHTIYDAVVLAWIGPKLARRAKGPSAPPA